MVNERENIFCMKPLISIITPCYNSASFIVQAMDSVLAQTFEDWEMLIADDCSTDDSAAIVQEYARQDSRIRYYRTDSPSGGPSIPRNIGLEHARGEYIAFLDSDDLWLPEKLKEQLSFLVTHKLDFVYSDYEKITWKGERKNRVIHARAVSSFWDTIESNDIPCLTVLIRSSVIGNTRFKHIPKEDYVFWLDILRQGYKAYNTGKIHALYREAKNSRSANKFKMFMQQWYVLRQIEGVKKIPAAYFLLIFSCKGLFKFLK